MQFNRPQITDAVAKFFGIKGAGSREFDFSGAIVPVFPLPGMLDAPYLTGHGIQVGRGRNLTAGVGEHAYLTFQPGDTVILQVEQIQISNEGAADILFVVGIMTATQFGALAGAVPGSAAKLYAFSGRPGAGDVVSSISQPVASTTTPVTQQIISIGRLAPGVTFNLPLPRPGVCLFGNDPGGRPRLYVGSANTASSLGASIQGREWELPG